MLPDYNPPFIGNDVRMARLTDDTTFLPVLFFGLEFDCPIVSRWVCVDELGVDK